MKCPTCGAETKYSSMGETMVGYSHFVDKAGVEHWHNDNCLKRYYICVNGHRWVEALRRTCEVEGCEWLGKETCFCHPGPKVRSWTDANT